jgi:hypothetical protein
MEVQDIKGSRLLKYLLKQHKVVCQLIYTVVVQAQ